MYCNCSCHAPYAGMVHCFPCCTTCTTCGAHVNHGQMEAHILTVHPMLAQKDTVEDLIGKMSKDYHNRFPDIGMEACIEACEDLINNIRKHGFDVVKTIM